MTTRDEVELWLRQREIVMVWRLMHLDENNEITTEMRLTQAQDIVLEYLEQLPMLSSSPGLLQPLYAARDLLSPAMGDGMGVASSYILQASAVGTVNYLRQCGMNAEEARRTVAEIMTTGGQPVTAETIRSWPKGANGPKFEGVSEVVARRIGNHTMPRRRDQEDPPMLRDQARDWFRQEVARYRRRD